MLKQIYGSAFLGAVCALVGCSSPIQSGGSAPTAIQESSCTLPTIDADQRKAIDEILSKLDPSTDKTSLTLRREWLTQQIVGQIYDKVNTMAWEKGLHHNNHYNVVVMDIGANPYFANLYGSYSKDFTYHKDTRDYGFTLQYKVWVFSHGTFENGGYNGYDYWAMFGTHDHKAGTNQKTVTFTQPPYACEK